MLSRISVSHRIYLAVGTVLAVLMVQGIFGYVQTAGLGGAFVEYRSTARQTLLLNDVLEDVLEARLAAFAYRIDASPEKAAAVEDNVTDIADARAQIEEFFANDPEALRNTLTAVALSGDYAAAFAEMRALQAQREDIVARIAEIGPKARMQITEIMDTAYRDGDERAAYYAGTVQQELMLGRFYAERFLLTNTRESLQRSIEHLETATAGIATLLEELQNPRRRQLAQTTSSDIGEYSTALQSVAETIFQRNAIRTDRLDRIGPQMIGAVEAVLDDVVARQNTIGPASTQRVSVTLLLIPAILVLALMVGAAAAVGVTRSVVRALSGASDTMASLSKGELDVEIQGEEHNHEIGAMARAMRVFRDNAMALREKADKEYRDMAEREQHMAEMASFQDAFGTVVEQAAAGDFSSRIDTAYSDPNLAKVATAFNALVEAVERGVSETGRVMAGVAEGDLEQRVAGAFSGAFERLQEDVNTTVGRLGTLVKEIAGTSVSMEQGASLIAADAKDMSRRTESQAASLEETAASMEEISATVRANAEAAADVSQFAAGAAEKSSATGQVVEETVQAMSRIQDSASKISEIITVIDAIAFQTNLLALNAAVEAARAGEAGKGFAVVASEVRTLAQRSSDASRDIRGLIETSSGQISEGVDLVHRTGDSLREILTAVGEMAKKVEAITQATKEQSMTVDEVARAVGSLDQITQQNAVAAEKSASAASGLSEHSKALTNLVGFFEGRSTPSSAQDAA